MLYHHRVEILKLPPCFCPDEGLGSSGRHFGSNSVGSGSAGSGSLYLSDSQDWVVSPSCSPPDEGPVQHSAISPMLAEETFRYMSKCVHLCFKAILCC